MLHGELVSFRKVSCVGDLGIEEALDDLKAPQTELGESSEPIHNKPDAVSLGFAGASTGHFGDDSRKSSRAGGAIELHVPENFIDAPSASPSFPTDSDPWASSRWDDGTRSRKKSTSENGLKAMDVNNPFQ